MFRACVIFASMLACSGMSADLEESFAFSINPQELSEDDALDRFEIDEWFLPKLNIELPALFDWSAVDSAYYARANGETGEREIGLC